MLTLFIPSSDPTYSVLSPHSPEEQNDDSLENFQCQYGLQREKKWGAWSTIGPVAPI